MSGNSGIIDAVVTGAGGFIGSALVRRLEKHGHKVAVLTRASGDITDPATWRKLPPAHTLFHLAGRTYVPDSWKHPAEFIHTNVLGTQRALDYCRLHGTPLVLASAYVYGIPSQLPVSEHHATHPNNPYALSKILAEQLCEFAAGFQELPVTVLRIFNIYGHGQRPEFLIPTILQYIEKHEPIVVQDLLPRRDYIYLEDVVDVFMRARQAATGFRRINIGSGESYSVKDIIDILQAEAGTDLPIISVRQERRQEIPDVKADITLARQILGWSPQYDLQAGIRHMISKK